MADGRQAPSGTVFGPRPQFQVHEVVSAVPLAVTGRRLFAPVCAGTLFTLLSAPGRQHPPEPARCRLRVEEIRIFGRRAGELDQVMSAHIVLSGSFPPELGPGSVLIDQADGEAGQWRRAGSQWVRAGVTAMTADAPGNGGMPAPETATASSALLFRQPQRTGQPRRTAAPARRSAMPDRRDGQGCGCPGRVSCRV